MFTICAYFTPTVNIIQDQGLIPEWYDNWPQNGHTQQWSYQHTHIQVYPHTAIRVHGYKGGIVIWSDH